MMMDGVGGGPSPYGPPIQARPQTPGAMSMMGGGAPSAYGTPAQHRPQTPGAMGMMGGGGGINARSMSPGPGMMGGGMNARSMSPGPGMMGGGMNARSMSPGPGMMGPPQPRPQMMPHAPSYVGGAPGAGRNMGNMPPLQQQQRQGPMVPSPSMGYGMQQGMMRPQSPAYQMAPQGQYAPPGTPGGPRPGTPGRMQYHGQAF